LKYTDAPAFLKGFLMHKKVISNRSDLTVNEYALDLCNFFRFTIARENAVEEEKVDLNAVTLEYAAKIKSEHIYEYMLHVSLEKHNGASARARKLVAIREFYKYLTREKIIKENPAADISTPTVKHSLPKFLTLEESIRLLECINSDVNNENRMRDYAMITLFLNCGMRLSELVGINLQSIDWENKSLRVLGKGNKERTVYLNDACIAAVNNYLPIRLSLECQDKNALFVSRNKKRISNKTVQWTVKKYLEAAGLGGRQLSTHKLRHTAATLMYSTGKVDVRVLKDILGHEQLNTTQIYTHVVDSQMKSAINANPLASITTSKKKDEENND
jgi:site-specific recombinase XerD